MYRFRFIEIRDLKKNKCQGKYPGLQSSWIIDWFQVFEKEEDNIFGFRKKPYIVAVYQGNKQVAIVPLLSLNRRYFKFLNIQFLEFLGQQWSGMGYDIIKTKPLEESFTTELLKWLKKSISFDFLFLKYLPYNSILSNKLKLYKYSGALYINPEDYASYEEFVLNVYSRKFRENLRRTLRRIEEDEYEMTICHEEINEESLKSIRNISQSKTTNGKSNLYASSKKLEFHLKMYRNFPSQVVFVKFNDQVVAYGTSIDYNGQRIGVDMAFERKYHKYGVGIHCVDAIIRQSFREVIQKLSFGLGMDSYKFQFTNKIEEFHLCFDYKFRLKSLLALPYFLFRVKAIHKKVSAIVSTKVGTTKTPGKKKEKATEKPLFVSATKKLQHSN